MKIIGRAALFFAVSWLVFTQAWALEEKFFDLSGAESTEVALKKIGSPKGVKITVQKNPERIIGLEFNPPHPFSVENKDLFEHIEIVGKGDRINREIVLADPGRGRIFYLTPQLKVSRLDLIAPWAPKEKLKSLQEILREIDRQKGEAIK